MAKNNLFGKKVKHLKNKKGRYVDSNGRELPSDNYVIQPKEMQRSWSLRIVNPDVARDNKKGSFTFGKLTRAAARKLTNKRHKAKA